MTIDGGHRHDTGWFDDWFTLVLVAAALLAAIAWSGAQLAALATTGRALPIGVGDAFTALLQLPSTPGDPARAWPQPARSHLPGPVPYWAATAIAAGLEGAVGWRVVAWLTRPLVGTPSRRRFGIDPTVRLARPRDLRTLTIPGPTPGRFILGRVAGRLVATENRATAPTTRRRWRHRGQDRQGDRTAVAVIGPARSGKTVNVISGILEWDGPAILSSVRDDLFTQTVTRRSQLGDVYVFDPLNALGDRHLPHGAQRVGWSPLQGAETVSGAMEAANVLLEAAPVEGTTNANYWNRKGEALLWPVLHAAAIDHRTMADVVRWLAIQDGAQQPAPQPAHALLLGPRPDPAPQTSEIRAILHHAANDPTNPARRLQAQHALAQFDGFWLLDHRTRSDIYSTSQTLVQPWEDPRISHASSPDAGTPITLADLLTGRNTLYVVQPLKSAQRFSVVFGGLLGALLKDQAYDLAHRAHTPLPDLLVVIDEAGNTPLQWLPTVASTCAGIGVLLITVWQSKAQIDAAYQKQADPLLTNHGTKLFFAGISDDATLTYAAALTGDEELHQRSTSHDPHRPGRTVSHSTIHRRLAPPETLRRLAPGEALLIHGTLPPAHLQTRRYWHDPALRTLAAGRGETPAPWQLPDAIQTAINHDPTPPEELLSHLPGYTSPD